MRDLIRQSIARLWLLQRANGRRLRRSQEWRICARLNSWQPDSNKTAEGLRQEIAALFRLRHA